MLKAWLLLALVFASVAPAWSLSVAPAKVQQSGDACAHQQDTMAAQHGPGQAMQVQHWPADHSAAADSHDTDCCCCGAHGSSACNDCHLMRLAWLPNTLEFSRPTPFLGEFFSVSDRFQSADLKTPLRPPIADL